MKPNRVPNSCSCLWLRSLWPLHPRHRLWVRASESGEIVYVEVTRVD